LRRSGRRTPPRPRSGPPRPAVAVVVGSIELDGPIGSHTLEAVRLEIRRLARACGLDLVEVRAETRGKRTSG